MLSTLVSSATIVRAYDEQDSDDIDNEYKRGGVTKNGTSYDDYDDFSLGMNTNTSDNGSGGGHQKRNKTNYQQVYSSKHTRLRENRVSSAKTASPKR